MKHARSGHGSRHCPMIVAALALLAAPMAPTLAADALGIYVGASIGQARVDATTPIGGDFRENHSAFKVLAGVRPISLLGAELSYVDLGHPTGTVDGPNVMGQSRFPADVSMKGAAAFGVLYLPVPVLDVFVKAGPARLQSTANSAAVLPGVGACAITYPNCALVYSRLDRTNTSLAAGAGAQMKFGSCALRAEYERFSAAGGHPGLLSLGFTWTIL
jgi:opacity protein-like surface antigen